MMTQKQDTMNKAIAKVDQGLGLLIELREHIESIAHGEIRGQLACCDGLENADLEAIQGMSEFVLALIRLKAVVPDFLSIHAKGPPDTEGE